MSSFSDTIVTYKLMKALTTPFERWQAYELGLIDKDGNTLKPAVSKEEKDSFPRWKKLVRKLKQILPGKSKLSSIAGAAWLIKEELSLEDDSLVEKIISNYCTDSNVLIELNESKNLNTVDKGLYEHVSGKTIYIRQDPEYVDNFMGIDIYKATDFITNEQFIITFDDIRKIKNG
jgi:hypothetical protein